MTKDKFIIIDGNSLMHRAFYALPPLTNKKGLHTNVIYGFVNMLNKIISDYKPSHIGIAFDRKAPTFRHLEYTEYKAGRKKMPSEMAEQIPVLKQVIDALSIKQIEMDGFEADDLIGAVSLETDKMNIETLIVTGDRDAFQLISDNVHVLITKKGISEIEEYDRTKLQEAYGITPEQVADFKGLMGDASDNIPGVPGVGEKTAVELIKQFGSLEMVLENSADIKKNKVRENVQNNKEQAIFSKKLATIIRELPMELNLEDYYIKSPKLDELSALYEELEFKSLLDKLNIQKPSLPKEEFVIDLVHLNDEKAMVDAVKAVKDTKEMIFKLYGGDGALIPGQGFISHGNKQYYFDLTDANLVYLRELMEDPAVSKISHDIKSDLLILKHFGIASAGIAFDTMIAAYLLDPSKGKYKLSDVAKDILGIDFIDYEGKNAEALQSYGSTVKAVADLWRQLDKRLEELEMKELFYKVELPLVEVLADMEFIGFNADRNMLEKLSADFSEHIQELTDSIYIMAGEKFNINSTKQLGVILFEKLGLPVIKKTKTGFSTDVEVLEELADKHPIVEKLLEYRQLVKIKSTYIDGLINIINPTTGKIHSKLNQTVTATGRLSSTEPNLQNIPVKTENGRQIRKVFVPSSEEYVLVDADYSQIELRILAHISGDESMIESFVKNEDIHTRTASEVFNVPIEEVTSLMRSRAKAVNFGIVYGISDFGLSKDLKIFKKEAKQYIESYFERYPNVKKYMEDIVAQAKIHGYVTTIMNRRRYIPEIQAKNAVMRGFGERMAMNTPIQGSAADVIKVAMIKVYKELKKRNLRSRLILQVHDELIVETHIEEIYEVSKLLKDNMEEAVVLRVPLLAEVSSGKNWFDSK